MIHRFSESLQKKDAVRLGHARMKGMKGEVFLTSGMVFVTIRLKCARGEVCPYNTYGLYPETVALFSFQHQSVRSTVDGCSPP